MSLKRNGVYTSVITSVCTECPLRTLHTIDDEDEDHVLHKDILESQDDEFARSVRVRDAWPAVRSMLWTLIRVLRRAAASRPDRRIFEPPRTLYDVLRNNSHRGGIACFGEVVWAHVPGRRLVRGKFEVNWPVLVWLGKRERIQTR